MPISHAVVLGVVQGLTEFFPVSSSGHLAIVTWLFGWDDFEGNDSLAKAFDVALHIGTLVAVVSYFRRELWRYARAGLRSVVPGGRPLTSDARMAWLLAVSAVPAAIVGAALSGLVEELDDRIGLVAAMLIVFGLVLAWADRLPRRRSAEDWVVRDATRMGLGQAVALIPGVSRSGITMSVARSVGYNRDGAARLAFLMSVPIIAGAGLFKFVQVSLDGGIPAELRAAFVWGALTAAVTGWIAVWATLRLVRTRSFTPFVVERVALGALVLFLLATGLR